MRREGFASSLSVLAAASVWSILVAKVRALDPAAEQELRPGYSDVVSAIEEAEVRRG